MPPPPTRVPLRRACLAEVIGTFMLVFFGTGAVWVAVLTGALQGLFQAAIVWGFAIALAICATGAVSGAHINPSVTIALWAWRGFPRARVLPYLGSQLAGAFLAPALLLALFSGVLAAFEREKNITRGQPGSELSAMVFGEYFPNPAAVGASPQACARVSELQAMTAEGCGTAVLVFLVFALTDLRNPNRPNGTLNALFIGLTITILICVLAPLTQAGFNPARDFGPRLLASFSGWGSVAIPGPRGGFFSVYILSPIAGGLMGGGLYDLLLRPAGNFGDATVRERELYFRDATVRERELYFRAATVRERELYFRDATVRERELYFRAATVRERKFCVAFIVQYAKI